ncbi:MAG: hypothetical protein ABW003_04770 [Microvirga sp.]
MFGWIARLFLIIAGLIVSWFVARDAAIFGVVQLMVALVLMTAFVAIVAFWPARWLPNFGRFRKSQ